LSSRGSKFLEDFISNTAWFYKTGGEEFGFAAFGHAADGKGGFDSFAGKADVTPASRRLSRGHPARAKKGRRGDGTKKKPPAEADGFDNLNS
jgi:hypothetical protein